MRLVSDNTVDVDSDATQATSNESLSSSRKLDSVQIPSLVMRDELKQSSENLQFLQVRPVCVCVCVRVYV